MMFDEVIVTQVMDGTNNKININIAIIIILLRSNLNDESAPSVDRRTRGDCVTLDDDADDADDDDDDE